MTSPGRVVRQVALLANDRLRAEVREHLEGGGLIAYPTATVYGFGGQTTVPALDALDQLKQRSGAKSYLVIIPDAARASGLRWTEGAHALARRFWPGPLTLVLSDPGERFPNQLRGPGGGVAIRLTGHLGARAALAAAGSPLTSTSANLPGERPAESGDETVEVTRRLDGRAVWVLDGGRLPPSPPSTLVDCTGDEVRVLREGAIPTALIDAVAAGGDSGSGDPAQAGPGLRPRPTRVLFVCTGNTCRSPMAEAIARERVRQLGWRHLEVASAGVWAAEGHPASPEAVQVAERRGLQMGSHQSLGLSPDRLRAADLILTMGPGHLEVLLETEAAARASTLSAFADGREDPFDGQPVPDPIGMGLDIYEATFRRLEESIGLAFARLAPVLGPS